MHDAITLLTFAFVLGILCQWLAWRVHLPAILFLLLTGILLGPVLGVLKPALLLGDILYPLVSFSVAIILFEGSLTLKLHEIRKLRSVVRNMVSVGLLITWGITTLVTHYVLFMGWQLAALFGAIMVVTGPTVIGPMLRTVRPNANVANILRWEGIVIDPIGASAAVLVYEFIVAGGDELAWAHTLLTFSRIVVVGFSVGILGGFLFGKILRRHWLPEYLQSVSALAWVFGVFVVSNWFQAESGLVTITVMGVMLANMDDVDTTDILHFKESLSIMLISMLFIVLAARLDLESIFNLGWPVLWVFVAIQFLARPLNVMVSSFGSDLTWPERHLLSWIAPRGIVAAAISALFSMQLERQGHSDAAFLVPLTFTIIIGTVLLQSLTARPLARLLNVTEPDSKGFLIIGANVVGRHIAKALSQNGFRTLLVDSNYDNISKAKMEGLETFLGNAISEHTDRHINLIGIGRLLALLPNENLNVAVLMHYRLELGQENVYTIRTRTDESISTRQRLSQQIRGQMLFGSEVVYSTLAMALTKNRKGSIRSTQLTSGFGFKELQEKMQDQMIPLFAIDAKKNLHIFVTDKKWQPQAEWILIYLYRGDKDSSEA